MDHPKHRLIAAVAAFALVLLIGLIAGLSDRVKPPEEGPPGGEPEPPRAETPIETPGAEDAGDLPPTAAAKGLRERSPSPWRMSEADRRQIVEITLRPVGRPQGELLAGGGPAIPLTARLEISLGRWPAEAPAKEAAPVGARVFDSRGRELGAGIAPLEGSSASELIFEAQGGGAGGPFEVYYPAPGGKALPSPGPEKGISLAVYPLRTHMTEGFPSIQDIARIAKKTRPIERVRRRAQINDCKLPFDRHDYYVAIYHGYLACRQSGPHAFGLDADDYAYLVIDGESVLAGGAAGKLPKRPFPYRASKSLRAGLHALSLYHVQRKGAQRARLAWQPPGSRRMRVIPPSAFVSHLPAKAVALERHERASVEPFFSAELRRRLVVNRSVAVTEWELVASGPKTPQEPVEREAPAPESTGPAAVHRESGGLCVMEAERFTGIDQRSDEVSWTVAKEHAGYSGGGYMSMAQKGADERISWQDSCEITFKVEISTPGDYYIAWRHLSTGNENNSVWTGLDGADRSQGVGFHKWISEGWVWQRGLSPLGRLGAGVHTIHLRRREGGFSLDRLAIATDPDRLPEDNSPDVGPPESPRGAGPVRTPAGREEAVRPSPASLRWVWREDGRVLGRQGRLRLFISGLDYPEAGLRPWREITLSLEGSSGEFGRYTRRLSAKPRDPLEDDGLSFRIEAASALSFLYPGEPFEIHLRAVNDSSDPVVFEAVESRLGRSGGRPGVRRLGDFELPAVGSPTSDVIARRMNRIRRRFEAGECERIERVVYSLGPPGAPATSLGFVLLDSRSHDWPGLRAEAGALVLTGAARAPRESGTALGMPERPTRAIFVMPYDSESDLRRWAFFRKVSLEGKDRHEALLYGDTLASPGAVGGEGLVPRMREELGRVKLRAAAFPEGASPIHAAAAGVSAELARAKWGKVWISLGTLDVRAGTAVREYERGIDLLVDRAWSLAPRARLVLVGPPPEPGREDVSARYADAARRIARRHHVEFVDLHELVMSLDDPDAAYRESGPDDSVRFPYPLAEAMDAVARAVLGK